MQPFRKHVAIAIDGGGLRGVIATQALTMLEDFLQQPLHELVQLAVGTSTGAIISAGLCTGISARKMNDLYLELGETVFPHSLRKALFPLTRYRYPAAPFEKLLNTYFGSLHMGDLWGPAAQKDLVITSYDLAQNRTLFIKPWKMDYLGWPLTKAVQASCVVPTYFEPVEGRYIDGGVGSYANPCYVAVFEAVECLHWDPAETTLISIGTGRDPYAYDPQTSERIWPWEWIGKVMGVFSQSAYDQQVHLVETYFSGMDFRRFQVNLHEMIEMDDGSQLDRLAAYGQHLGRNILADRTDPIQGVSPKQPAVTQKVSV